MKTPIIWWIMAGVWGVASYAILDNYIQIGSPEHLNQIWFLCSLIWAQFGLAGAFAAMGRRQLKQAFDRLFIAVFPPLLLHLIVFSLIR